MIGFLRSTPLNTSTSFVAAFRQGLKESGFNEGQNVAVEFRSADNQIDRLPAGAFEAAYSNFGPLNCVSDLSVTAGDIASRLVPGGLLLASAIWMTMLQRFGKEAEERAERRTKET